MSRRVAVVYPSSAGWIFRCLDGIRRYARENGDWHLFISPPALLSAGGSVTLEQMQGWKGDAMIAHLHNESELRKAHSMGIPVVNLASWLPESFGIPRVMVNHFQAGRLAADHLLSRGLRHLALFGWEDAWYANQRQLGFTKRAAESGVPCDVFLLAYREEAKRTWTQRIVEPAKWLATLPRPCGVFAVHDYMAQLLMEACHEADLRIPDDVAVIGMDDDATIAEHSVPTLTSVSRNSERVGWEAAALLDRMMRGAPAPTSDLLVDPDGVVPRQSTDMLYCSEPVLQRALEYMRARLNQQFNISQLAEDLRVSKRTLEMRFRENFQSSPHDFLTKLRVQHAQTLIHTPRKLTTQQIADECGFGTVRALYKTFQRINGESFGAFRRRGLKK